MDTISKGSDLQKDAECALTFTRISINLVQGNCTSFTHNHSMDETLDNKGEKLKNAMQYKFIQKCYDLERKTKPF